ncbi:glutaredoxin family protein [Pendulispora albinea]|uniref:Glutaredoxin family protein n=1 Tax=Pendulispora albinea TaxID=2741071 RepID=A0ABZ2LRX5_9BACT
MKGRAERITALLAACCILLPSAGCSRKRTGNETAAASAGDNGAAPFTVTDASDGLLFTWIDEHGDFHVEQKAADVPLVGRDSVRVVDPTREEGTHPERIFVADLRTTQPDGSYLVKTMTKPQFDELAVARRKGKTALLEPTDAAAAAADPRLAKGGGSSAEPGDPNARPAVIIYGAEWCGACHQAAAYLRSKGIPYVEKDIEADRGAAREMQGKLAKAGLGHGSIPVLDVRGKVMVGFNPRVVDEALGAAM